MAVVVGDILTAALRMMGAASLESPAAGAYGDIVKSEYNALMHEWTASSAFALKGADGAIYVHADQGSNDAFPLGDDLWRGVAALVAIRAAAEARLEENITERTRSAAHRGIAQALARYQAPLKQDAGILRRDRYYS